MYFNEFKPDSFNIQVLYWYAPPDWWEYMDHSERVNLRIMEEFERLGVEFASPPRPVYLPPRDAIARPGRLNFRSSQYYACGLRPAENSID